MPRAWLHLWALLKMNLVRKAAASRRQARAPRKILAQKVKQGAREMARRPQFQGTSVPFSEPARAARPAFNSGSRGSDTLLQPPRAPGACLIHRHTHTKHLYIENGNKIKQKTVLGSALGSLRQEVL